VDKSLKGFYQHINCPGKTLDKCYGSVSEAYKATPCPLLVLLSTLAFY